jgi:Right handed beta helix region
LATITKATPEDYGAIGNGVTDDTAALQQLFDSNEYVFIPNKTYKVRSVDIKKPINIESDGGVIKPSTNNWAIRTTVGGIKGITIKGLTFDGTNGSSNCGLFIEDATQVLVEGLTFKNMPVSAFLLSACTHFEIAQCDFDRIGTDKIRTSSGVTQGCAIVAQNSSYGNIHHNNFYDIWQIPVFVWANDGECLGVSVHHNHIDKVEDNAIRFQPDPQRSTGIQDWNAVRGCNASFNTIKNVRIDGVRLSGNSNQAIGNLITNVIGRAITTQGGNDLTVSKNIIMDCAEGIRMHPDIVSLLRATVEGNEVYNTTGAARAIAVIGNGSPTKPGVRIRDCIVVNNKIHDSAGYGLEITDLSAGTVANNFVRNVAKSAIYVRDTDRIKLDGNIAKNGNLGGGPYSGIHLGGRTTQAIVTGNLCTDDGSKTQTWGIYLESGVDYTIVRDNSLVGNKSGGVYSASSNPTTVKLIDNMG